MSVVLKYFSFSMPFFEQMSPFGSDSWKVDLVEHACAVQYKRGKAAVSIFM